ncbi:MAG TPA: flagellar basal body P-ring protein FlgI [Rhodospirillaceae bacterium]|nr:flagellar basal body P-ring protein FlgI [Rhodospirillaceae bacterium]
MRSLSRLYKPFRHLPRRVFATVLALAVVLSGIPLPAHASSRIKDIADFEGVRANMLVGYGLVVGLTNTGDQIQQNAPFTQQSLVGMLERLGVNTRDATGAIPTTFNPKNVAAVMVTAELPAFAKQGTRIDVSVAALGDAKNLTGGQLLVTPLLGADGEVYAVAQGPLANVGVVAQGQGASVQKGVPTAGKISSGAIVEREIPFEMSHLQTAKLTLRNPDFTTARRVAQAVNAFLGSEVAHPIDPASVQMVVPTQYVGNVVGLLTDIEQLKVDPDSVAKVVIDEASGTIVMGENVRISTVAIAQGQLTIRITETPQVSQPSPFSSTGSTAVVNRTDIQVDEGQQNKLAIMDHGVTLQELVNNLNALGIGPRDMIPILEAIKAAGALQAEIQVM